MPHRFPSERRNVKSRGKGEIELNTLLKILLPVGFQQSLSCPSPLRGKELIKSRKV